MIMESTLLLKKHVLVYDENSVYGDKFNYVVENFCGIVSKIIPDDLDVDSVIYLCGDVSKIKKDVINVIYVIKNESVNTLGYELIDIGQVPINYHNVGVYFKKLFDDGLDYFDLIHKEHAFQSLTESNKESNAFRNGIYLTKVVKGDDGIHFNLLRCSTNLDGPTDNFRETDNIIIDQLNQLRKQFFVGSAEFNHVLAQTYINKSGKKAKISQHSDKTKDMPSNALMAFCTFYDTAPKSDAALTKLRFKLKNDVPDKSLTRSFDVMLYPNSVFVMSLTTNRLYTHEIIPSVLPNDKVPTRLGYVVRCSKTKAIFKNDETYIIENGEEIRLKEASEKDFIDIKEKYYQENVTSAVINYGDVHFSLNKGDYMSPGLIV